MSSHLLLILVLAWVAVSPALATVVGRTLRSGGAVPVETSRRDRADDAARALVDASR